MLIFVKLLAPALAGGAVAAGVLFGAVQVQTALPDTNPATKQILTYGDTN